MLQPWLQFSVGGNSLTTKNQGARSGFFKKETKMSEVCCMYKTMAEQAKKSRKQRPNSGRKKMVTQDVKLEVS